MIFWLILIGDYCENDYNACNLDPCNGGTCIRISIHDTNATRNLSEILGYKCISCQSGYEVSAEGTKCIG
jgi:hypothetical protein